MAKENTVILYGWVTSGEVIERTIGFSPASEIDMLTLRKSGVSDEMLLTGQERETVIPVISKGRYMRSKMQKEIIYEGEGDSYKGCFVLVKGTFCTDVELLEYECPHCGAMTEHAKSIEYIDPLEIWRVNFDELSSYADALPVLRKHIEISNMSLLYGTVSREPEYYTGGKTEFRFPLIARRKRHIHDDPIEKTADRPWIRSFGEANEDYSENIHHHSGIYINGALQGREFDDQTIHCEECGKPFEISAKALENIPYAMKYQKFCGDEEEAEELDGGLTYLPPDENTAILIGWVSETPKLIVGEKDKPTMARISMRVFRKRYDGDDPAHRGETRSDLFHIKTNNKNLIDYIATQLAAPQPKNARGHMGYIVIVKGTLKSGTKKMIGNCTECGGQFAYSFTSAEIDPIGIWKEAGPFTADEAAFLLHGISEIGNMIWCHGTVVAPPEFEGDERMAICRFLLETSRTRRIYGEKGIKDVTPVAITGEAARSTVDVIHEGSVVFINGALRSVGYNDPESQCPHCGAIVPTPEVITEIVPYQIEYHTNCDIPESVLYEEDSDYE